MNSFIPVLSLRLVQFPYIDYGLDWLRSLSLFIHFVARGCLS